MKSRIVISIAIIILISLFACSGKNKANLTNNKSEVPDVLKGDTLLNVYDFQIVDTFDNGAPMTIWFFEKSEPDNPLYEKKYYRTGHIFIQGAYKNRKRDGEWTAWYENGVLWSYGEYKNGLRNGKNMAYYENGALRYSKEYKYDIADGSGKFYTPDGDLATEIMYADDSIVWKKEYGSKE